MDDECGSVPSTAGLVTRGLVGGIPGVDLGTCPLTSQYSAS